MSNSRLVVLVEDSPTQAKAIALYLNQLGVEVMICPDGPEGIAAVVRHQPGAVVLDVNLPTMDGFQVARRLKRHPATSNIPLIMLTKLDKTDDMLNGLDQGADYYIPKGANAADELRKTLTGFGILNWK